MWLSAFYVDLSAGTTVWLVARHTDSITSSRAGGGTNVWPVGREGRWELTA